MCYAVARATFLGIYIRWYCWPDRYLINSLEALEHYYIGKKDRLPPGVATYIEELFKFLYTNTQVSISQDIEKLIKTIVNLAQTPRYAPLHFDRKFLQEELRNYKPAVQKQVKTAIFTLKQVSTLVSQGKQKRIMILFAGPPGTGKTRLANLIFQACGLPAPMEINLEGNQQEIFGTPEKRGRITQAHVDHGFDTNANLAIIMNDADRALGTKDSAVYLHILDANKFTYPDPSLDHFGITCQLPPFTIMTVNKLPPAGDAVLDRFAVVIDFTDPFTDRGFVNIGIHYLKQLAQEYAQQEGAPTWKDFTNQERQELEARIRTAKEQKQSVRQIENMLRDYFMQKWEDSQGS